MQRRPVHGLVCPAGSSPLPVPLLPESSPPPPCMVQLCSSSHAYCLRPGACTRPRYGSVLDAHCVGGNDVRSEAQNAAVSAYSVSGATASITVVRALTTPDANDAAIAQGSTYNVIWAMSRQSSGSLTINEHGLVVRADRPHPASPTFWRTHHSADQRTRQRV